MRKIILAIAVTVVLLTCAVITLNQESLPSGSPAPQSDERSESLRLTAQVQDLYKQGKYDEAIPLAKRVLEIEERLNPETANVATALSNLAALYFERRFSARFFPASLRNAR